MLSDSSLFIRRAELIIGQKVEVSNAAIEPPDALSFKTRVRFKVEKTDGSEPNKATIDIFNLSLESRNFIERKNSVVFLKAGYQNSIGLIFFGDIAENGVKQKREGADIITTIEAGDSEIVLADSHLELSLARGATTYQIIEAAAKELNLSIGVKKDIVSKTYMSGFSFSGSVKKLLDDITRFSNVTWTIQDGELLIMKKESNDGREAILLSKSSGLIGIPTKLKDAYEFTSLLNYSIRPKRLVKIETSQLLDNNKQGVNNSIPFSDFVTVTKAVYEGDTHDGKWEVKCEGQIYE